MMGKRGRRILEERKKKARDETAKRLGSECGHIAGFEYGFDANVGYDLEILYSVMSDVGHHEELLFLSSFEDSSYEAAKAKDNSEDSWVEKKEWNEFYSTGLLWFVNRILQVFGWSIMVDFSLDSSEITDVYPVRNRMRGFDPKTETENYEKVARWMKEHSEELYEEAEYG